MSLLRDRTAWMQGGTSLCLRPPPVTVRAWRLILLGPPGVGKGTQASLLALPSEAEIREYAHHLYVMSGWLPGRDLDNWLEAEAHLKAMMAPRSAPPKPARRRPVPAQPITV